MMRSQPELFPDYVGPLSVVVLEVAGILCMLLMFSVRTRPHYHDADDADLQPWHRFVKRNIKLFGIVLFFFSPSYSTTACACWPTADASTRG